MKKCQYCQQEMEEDVSVCPNCGGDNAAPEELEEVTAAAEEVSEEAANEAETWEAPELEQAGEVKQSKATPGKIALAVGAVVVLLAVLIALIAVGVKNRRIQDSYTETAVAGATTAAVEETEAPATVPADGNPEDVTAKGTYTVTDEEAQAARDTVIAAIDGYELTNGQLQVYYWSAVNSFLSSQQGYYLMMYGAIDYTKPLDTQICAVDDSLTWQQHFLGQALKNWRTSCALASEAEKANVEMSAEDREFLENMESYLTETAENYGMTVEELMLRNVGPGAGKEEFIGFQELYSQGSGYYNREIEKLVPTQEDLEAFFEAHSEEYAQGGVSKDSKFVDVRHILVTVKGGTADEEGKTVYFDEEWENCRTEAQAILDSWLAGDKTEEAFAALANEKSEDPGSNTTGGLYENVFEGQMVKPFEEWCFDAGRAYGDYGLVRTDYGYHVMYFVKGAPQWEYYARQDWLLEKTNEFIDSVVEGYPMEVDYSQVALGYLELGQ